MILLPNNSPIEDNNNCTSKELVSRLFAELNKCYDNFTLLTACWIHKVE